MSYKIFHSCYETSKIYSQCFERWSDLLKKKEITGKKEKKQIRLLKDTLTNLHVTFQKETRKSRLFLNILQIPHFLDHKSKIIAKRYMLMLYAWKFLLFKLFWSCKNRRRKLSFRCCYNYLLRPRWWSFKDICLERKCSKCINKVIEFNVYICNDSIFY